MTKILVNRLRHLLSELIGPLQNSFLPKRGTANNAIILQELLHKKGFLVAPPQRTTARGPLSPYLFVICMEKLSLAISGEVNARRWIPVKASRGGPGISHLLFAEDVLLFCTATSSQVHLAKDMLDRFVASSGLKVNAAKSRAFSSVRITRGCKDHLASITGIRFTTKLERYLGFPLLKGRVN
ncbi:hypothetical protein L6164_002011 [Bauhinia variegata]|uniref:Uncharacterized protein n=1 Tax=Bauhinia variegata TaxID=167791 RepID=A0ACB9PWU6_BAUVA|nr:hypothetical protein L6164_002011 [Bauhinia variegata]